MGNGALATGPKPPRSSSTLLCHKRTQLRMIRLGALAANEPMHNSFPSCCTGWRGDLSGSTTGLIIRVRTRAGGFDFGEHVFTNHGNKCQTGIILHSA